MTYWHKWGWVGGLRKRTCNYRRTCNCRLWLPLRRILYTFVRYIQHQREHTLNKKLPYATFINLTLGPQRKCALHKDSACQLSQIFFLWLRCRKKNGEYLPGMLGNLEGIGLKIQWWGTSYIHVHIRRNTQPLVKFGENFRSSFEFEPDLFFLHFLHW